MGDSSKPIDSIKFKFFNVLILFVDQHEAQSAIEETFMSAIKSTWRYIHNNPGMMENDESVSEIATQINPSGVANDSLLAFEGNEVAKNSKLVKWLTYH